MGAQTCGTIPVFSVWQYFLFENLGAPEDDYCRRLASPMKCKGNCAAVPGLQVTARSSAIQYKKTTKKPAEIGQELGVDYLLTGTVRWQDASGAPGGARRVRVSPELIRVADGIATWEQPFDTEMGDVFNVQADIASRVAKALDVAMGAGARADLEAKPTTNAAAYDAFLRGNELSQNVTVSEAVTLRKALAEYQKSVTLNPSFALAWAQLGRAACTVASSGLAEEDIDLLSYRRGASCCAGARMVPESRLALGLYYRLVRRPR